MKRWLYNFEFKQCLSKLMKDSVFHFYYLTVCESKPHASTEISQSPNKTSSYLLFMWILQNLQQWEREAKP